jgi:hypothetical protein
MSESFPKDYHTRRELDISNLPVEERIARFNTTEDVAVFYESSKGTRKRVGERWFECPVTGDFLPESEGIRVSGVLYERKAGQDILEDRRRGGL